MSREEVQSARSISDEVIEVAEMFHEDDTAAWLKRTGDFLEKLKSCRWMTQFVSYKDQENGVAFGVVQGQSEWIRLFCSQRLMRMLPGAGDGRLAHLRAVVDVENAWVGDRENAQERLTRLIKAGMDVHPGFRTDAKYGSQPGKLIQSRAIVDEMGDEQRRNGPKRGDHRDQANCVEDRPWQTFSRGKQRGNNVEDDGCCVEMPVIDEDLAYASKSTGLSGGGDHGFRRSHSRALRGASGKERSQCETRLQGQG
jgi:hypothetical protein